MTHNISRRSLIAGSALSALALGAAGQAQARTQNFPQKWDFEADVVVIGAGAVGLPAAILAREAGFSSEDWVPATIKAFDTQAQRLEDGHQSLFRVRWFDGMQSAPAILRLVVEDSRVDAAVKRAELRSSDCIPKASPIHST